MTLIGLLGILTSCHREEIPNDNPQQSGTPISFTPTSDWPTLTKSIITNENYKDFNFNIWATSEYSNKNFEVFEGEEIKHDGNDIWIPVSGVEKYWSLGKYDFIAVMPSGHVGTYSDGNLTLDFGDSGYQLGCTSENKDSQKDFLVAVAEDEFEQKHLNGEKKDPVSLKFFPQLSRINFTISNEISLTGLESEIIVTGFKIYGNHISAESWSNDGGWSFKELQGTSENPTPYFSASELSIEVNTKTVLVNDLLVFPEECSLSILVTYVEKVNGIESPAVTKSSSVPIQCAWQSGNQYTYPLKVMNSGVVLMGEPSVNPWPEDVTQAGSDIEIKN